MAQIHLNIPDHKLSFFMEMLSNFKFVEVLNPSSSKSITDNFDLDDEKIKILDQRAKTPSHLCISEEESKRRIDEL
jgi:hypothetical protein